MFRDFFSYRGSINTVCRVKIALERNGYKPVEFIYLGTRNDVYPCSYGKYHSFFPAGTLNTNMTSVIENYYSASPYPTTIGYQDENGIYKPVFPEGKNVNFFFLNVVLWYS